MNGLITKAVGILGIVLLTVVNAMAYFNPELNSKGNTTNTNDNSAVNFREDCVPSSEQTFLDINNVRARLLVGGDIWWDGSSEPGYIVPAPEPGSGDPEVSSIFAAGVWLGGLDDAGNLKIAASTYRTPGVDYFAGPLQRDNGQTDLDICDDWDRFWEVSGNDVRVSIAKYNLLEQGEEIDCDSIPNGVKQWPGVGNPFFTDFFPFDLPDTGQGLAAFWDEDESGDYNPCAGDFPIIEIRGCEPLNRSEAEKLVPDQMIFWIYNDAGAPHGLTTGEVMNMEIQVQAFAYQSNDEVNDMTFMRYKLINRGSSDLQNSYFGMWVDPDLGCSEDDFVGCDVDRSLAYTYNEDSVDGDAGTTCTTGAATYENDVPIIGTDYFRGPLAPFRFGTDSDGNKVLEEVTELGSTDIDTFAELGMTAFMYYNRSDTAPEPATGDPQTANDYYNYLQSIWLDETPLTQGGSGYNPGSLDLVKYAFPSDPKRTEADDWSMCTDMLPIADRRTIQATGPFLLKQGVTNELIVGAVWVPDLNYPCPDISRLQKADDLAQALFDNCFDFIDGPDAPDVSIIELDKELILVLSNSELSNNVNLEYMERDIFAADSISDAVYQFEGYRIYQLINANVSSSEYDDIEKAIEIAQVDVKNGVTTLHNWEVFQDPNEQTEGNFYTFNTEVEGSDDGILSTFSVTQDRFASGDTRLRNHKAYYFSAVAYGSNQYQVFDPSTGLGQQTPYLEGRRNIASYEGVPRPIVYENQNSNYGDGPIITRIDGEGNPGVFLELDDSMYDKILNGDTDGGIVYKPGAGPINVSIYNPLEVVDGKYRLEVLGEFDNASCALKDGATWKLTNLDTGQEVESDTDIDNVLEQVVPEFGLSLKINQVSPPGSHLLDPSNPFYTEEPTPNNGVISTSLEYLDENGTTWFTALTNIEQFEISGIFGLDRILNFMAIGTGDIDGVGSDNYPQGLDPNEAFLNNGTNLFYPFFAADGSSRADELVPIHVTPAFNRSNLHQLVRGTGSDNGLDRLNNVDIIFTSDKSKWSRCVVVETASEDYTINASTADGNSMFQLRKSPSKGVNGGMDGDGTGMSYFPGYAVDVVTGKRLNIFFGENSIYNQDFVDAGHLPEPIGDDMIWNPTSQVQSNILPGFGVPTSLESFLFGGNHFVYVSRTEYDGCSQLRNLFGSPSPVDIATALKSVTWTFMPFLNAGMELGDYAGDNFIPNDLVAKIRVQTPYKTERLFDINSLLGCTTEGGLPVYEFDIIGQATSELNDDESVTALDNVRAVPNPYYGFSQYEGSQFNTTIKLTNVPPKSQITIYSLDGKFVRQFNRDENVSVRQNPDAVINTQIAPDVEWDLKNYAGIPVASGVYLIHVLDNETGNETTVKWFGVNRKFDPSGL